MCHEGFEHAKYDTIHALIQVDTFSTISTTLESLINEQGGYVVFKVLSEYSFIKDFRVLGGSILWILLRSHCYVNWKTYKYDLD